MPRMSKKRKQEWALFLNERNRITYNGLCRKCSSEYTGVLLHEPESSLILLRAQQNKGVFFVCSLSGMVIPRAFLCIDRKHDHQRAEGIS